MKNAKWKVPAKVALCAVALIAAYMYGRHNAGVKNEIKNEITNKSDASVSADANKLAKPTPTAITEKSASANEQRPRTTVATKLPREAGDSTDNDAIPAETSDEATIENRGNEKEEVAAVLAKNKLHGTPEEKKALLKALVEFRKTLDSANASDTVELPASLEAYWPDNGVADDADNPEDDTFINTMRIMTAALEDEDVGVRDAAFDAMFDLPAQMSDILAMQIVTGDDDAMKDALLKAAAQGSTESSVAFLMHALDADNDAIKGKATEALKAIFSETFKSSDEAFEWWESHSSLYVFGDNGISLAPASDGEAKDNDGGMVMSDAPVVEGDEGMIKKSDAGLAQAASAPDNGGVEVLK